MAAYSVSASEKEKIITAIRSVLARESCRIAILFGSFLTGGSFRDIDLCVAWEEAGAEEMIRAAELADVLQNELLYPFDVIPFSVEDIPLRAAIAANFRVVLNHSPDSLDDFIFKAWIDIQDFRPRCGGFLC